MTLTTTSDEMSGVDSSGSDCPQAHETPRFLKLSSWLSMTYKEKDAPSIRTARLWARTGLIEPKPEKHGRDYFVHPSARYVHSLRQKQRGLTLIELTLSLVIGSIIVAGAIAYGSIVIRDSRISDEASRLRSLSTRIDNAFSGRVANYSLLATNGNQFAINNIGLQGIFSVSGTSIKGTFGDITVGTGADGPSAAANSSYRITYAAGALDRSQCLSLTTTAGPLFQVAYVGASQVKAANQSTVNVALAQTACTAGGAVIFGGYIN